MMSTVAGWFRELERYPYLYPSSLSVGALSLLFCINHVVRAARSLRRSRKVPRAQERVLILGATSGVGRTLAHQYTARGARVCVVGRREDKLANVVEECKAISKTAAHVESKEKILGIRGDLANVDDMVNLRAVLEKEWSGLDTLIVTAGVSALQPLMTVAGVEFNKKGGHIPQATRKGISKAVNICNVATSGNFFGPFTAAVTFIPLLSSSSASPSILLLSTIAAIIPPPTRTIYASTKAASLALYQALAIEHSSIAFSFCLPATIEGDFRASAVDSTEVHEADPNKHGIKREVVAKRCIKAIDHGDRTIWMPWTMRVGHFLYWIWPSFVEWRARVKYNF